MKLWTLSNLRIKANCTPKPQHNLALPLHRPILNVFLPMLWLSKLRSDTRLKKSEPNMQLPIRTLNRAGPSKRNGLSAFCSSEDGSATIESVIWFPIFAILLAVMMNVSMVFFTESQILRVVQDGNRAFSLGRLEDAAAVEAYIGGKLAYLNATLTVQTTISGGEVYTMLSTPATDLMPFNFMTSAFEGVNIGVHAQQLIEF